MIVDVVMRCRDEMPHTGRALDALAAQRGVTARVLFFDCGSRDGSREEATGRGLTVVDLDPATYRPGRVLNQGMASTTSSVVAFINADAVALDPDALTRLVEPLERSGGPGATFGRQRARVGARRLTRLDHERAFGAREGRLARGVFFSMAASALSRRAWQALPFDESLRYSEDADWTARAGSLGLRVEYCPGAHFEHSHDYSLRQQFRRRRGEGSAERAIFRLGAPSLWSDLVRPLVGSMVRDVRAGEVTSLPDRVAQAAGFFCGRLEPVIPG